MAQSCSKVMYCCVPLAPFALKRSSPPRDGKASSVVLQVVGVSCATPPPQMPLKSGWVCADAAAGSRQASKAAAPSCGRDWVMDEVPLVTEGVRRSRIADYLA